MARLRVSTMLPASPRRVWADVSDLASHVEWMADAESLTFTSRQRSGRGTTFDCVTRVGPIRLVDRMEVTEWQPRRSIGVQHKGLVTGSGRFTLRRRWRRTKFTWEEELALPWWLGGPVAAVVLRQVWRRNLRRLRQRF